MVIHILIDSGKLIFQRFDDDIYTFLALWMCGIPPVTFCYQHGNQLTSAHNHRSKNLALNIQQSPDKALPLGVTINDLCHLSEHSGINLIGFCQVAHSSGKISGLLGIYHRNVKASA
ncbi:TPA: hypothetical protein MB314_004831 [Klebsiella pneumoniae]|nr:hypothetical protein [Klebsiella pneumoniae]